MGSRAVVVICRDEDAARRRFGVVDDGTGIIYTRTGRRFFDDPSLERELVAILSRALGRAAPCRGRRHGTCASVRPRRRAR